MTKNVWDVSMGMVATNVWDVSVGIVGANVEDISVQVRLAQLLTNPIVRIENFATNCIWNCLVSFQFFIDEDEK